MKLITNTIGLWYNYKGRSKHTLNHLKELMFTALTPPNPEDSKKKQPERLPLKAPISNKIRIIHINRFENISGIKSRYINKAY